MCCLFGLIDYGNYFTGKQRNRILSVLAKECEVRGTDATGIAYNENGKLRIYKRPLPAHLLPMKIPASVKVVMGHTRMTTQGSAKRNRNNHPFPGKAGGISFALAHNGVIYNDLMLRREKKLPHTKIQTDSYIGVQLIEQKNTLDLNSLKDMAEQVKGTFVFTVLDEKDNVYFIKGNNPLCMYHYPKMGVILYASTEEVLKSALRKLPFYMERPKRMEFSYGDILKIDRKGRMETITFQTDMFLQEWYPASMGCWGYGIGTEYGLDDSYVEDLKSLAGNFGYSPEDVDTLLGEGFLPEELEAFFYCGEL